jgi:Fur family peroxide stress response transcriptional regulator
MKRRSTPQLLAVYEAVAASSDHPSADRVLERVRHSLPRVSLGTIYRNLDKLRDLERVRVLQLAGGSAHYDAKMDPHDHFVCESCAAVVDLDPQGGERHRSSLEQAGCLVRWQTTAVYGLCCECAAKSERSHGAAHG